ncbi:MAG: glycosyltransferase [bacterium]|nr:glycosyltransferase [bacterium]
MCRVAYVVKRYPRFSETFIVSELLAHEEAGLEIEIFSLRPPVDTHFQDLISQVRAPLTYLSTGAVKASELWDLVHQAQQRFPILVEKLGSVTSENALDVYCGLRLALASMQRGITHLHAHFASSAASVARIASKLSNIPYSITAHAKDIFHESVDHGDLESKLLDSSVTFTVSDFNLRHFQDRFASPAASKVVRLYNGMHLDQFPYESPLNRPPRIIAVGRFVEKKGFASLVEACMILRSRQVRFNCGIVGSGELQAELHSQIRALQLDAQVQLLGPQPQKVVKQLVRESAVMAAPCINGSDGNRDGLPTVLLEAMALGTPCVSTDVTGIPEVIVDGETGLLVGQRDPQALADALARLLADSEQRASLAGAARGLIEREFNIANNAAIQRRHFGMEPATNDAHSQSLQLSEV